MELADRVHASDDAGDDPRHLAARWRRRGLRAFEAEREAAATLWETPDGQEEGMNIP